MGEESTRTRSTSTLAGIAVLAISAVLLVVLGSSGNRSFLAIAVLPLLGVGVLEIQHRFAAARPESDASWGPTAAAGWYPDATMPGTRRLWDGATWTDHVAPDDGPGGKQVGVLTIARGVALGIGIVIAGLSILSR